MVFTESIDYGYPLTRFLNVLFRIFSQDVLTDDDLVIVGIL